MIDFLFVVGALGFWAWMAFDSHRTSAAAQARWNREAAESFRRLRLHQQAQLDGALALALRTAKRAPDGAIVVMLREAYRQ